MNYKELPKGYKKAMVLNLKKDRIGTVFVTALSCFLMLLMLLIGLYVCGSEYIRRYILISTADEVHSTANRFCLTLFGLFAYSVIKELIRIVLSKLLCKDCKVLFKYRVIYCYTVCSGYFSRKSYYVIVFLPVFILGLLLFYLCFAVAEPYFISVYLILTLNTSSIAGDIYAFYFILRFDKNLLIKDTGETVAIYSKLN